MLQSIFKQRKISLKDAYYRFLIALIQGCLRSGVFKKIHKLKYLSEQEIIIIQNLISLPVNVVMLI